MTAEVRQDATSSGREWLCDPRFAPLFDELVAAVVKQYRADVPAARRLLAEALANARLAKLVGESASPDDIRRTRVYKDAAAAAKRHVYHALRRYRPSEETDQDALIARLRNGGTSLAPTELAEIVDQLVNAHASTRERRSDAAAFYKFLANALDTATSVLDIGCGVQPLRFPFASLPSLRRYVAADSNGPSIDAVQAFAAATNNRALLAIRDDLCNGWQPIISCLESEEDETCPFDAALMLKLIPVIARQSRALLSTLAETPARRWIVTGSTTSLAKRTSIIRREQGVLRRFIADAGRQIRAEFQFGEEFGYIVE